MYNTQQTEPTNAVFFTREMAMMLKDFWQKVLTVKEKLEVVAKCNPMLDTSKVSAYLENIKNILQNYRNDYQAGRHQNLAGFREMALFNFERAEAALSEAIELTLKALKDAFSKKAHGRIPTDIVKAVLLRADEVLRMEGFASAKRHMERADFSFYLQDYDARVVSLSWLAGVKPPEVKVKRANSASRAEYFKRPFAIKVEKVAHKATASTQQEPPKQKVFTGRFVGDALPIARVNLEGGNILKAVTPDMRRAAVAQSAMGKVTSVRTENVRGTRKKKASQPRPTKAAIR